MHLLVARFAFALLLSPAGMTGQEATERAGLPLCEQLRALMQEPSVAAAHWGLQLTDAKGASLCSINEAQLFRPASNNKIFTTAAALALLGAEHTVTTTVTGALDVATGTVNGPLTLIGAGDANLDSHDLPYRTAAERSKLPPVTPEPPFFSHLEDLAAQLVMRGVKTVTGDIIGDDTLFPYEPYPIAWAADDLVWGYGAPVSALTIADNQLRLTITPAAAGQAATVTLDQHGVDYYTVLRNVDTYPAGSTITGIQVERMPGSRTVRVYGAIAADAKPDTEEIAIDDPALYAAMAFRRVLLAHGIAVPFPARARHAAPRDGRSFVSALHKDGGIERAWFNGPSFASSCPGSGGETHVGTTTLATHASSPLGQDVVLTNKVSQNLHAELLFHAVGRIAPCEVGSSLASARMMRAFLLRAGVLPNDFIFYDGSGLSTHDLVTPRALAMFLAYAATQPWFARFKASLPEAGADGTLSSRFKDMPAGRLFAKTGTLGESRALSGYLTTASGRQLIFSLMVDTHLPGGEGPPADRTVMDRIVETMAAQ